MRHYVSKNQNDWDLHLTAAEIAVNSSIQASTKFTPYYLNYGYEPSFNIDTTTLSIRNESAAQMLLTFQRDLEAARHSMLEARDRQTY